MNIPLQIQPEDENFLQDAWRERFLERILVFSAVVGLFALIPAVISAKLMILQGVYILVFVMLVALILVKLPYTIKASVFVLLTLLLGIGSLMETGIRGDALFFFLAFVTFSSLLIGQRAGVIAIAITELTIIVVGILVLSEQLVLSDKLAPTGDLADWISGAVSQALISLIITYALQMITNNFHETRKRAIAFQQSQYFSQIELERQIANRTQDLSRKTNLLTATSLITHQTAMIQDLDNLLSRTVALVSKHFGCYHVGIYLLNQRGDYLTLQAASSEGGQRLLERGYRLRIGTEGMIGYVAAEKKPRLSLDVDRDIIYLDDPELSETLSELALPLLSSNNVIGVLDLQSSEKNAFRYDEIEIFQSMADQIAVAIENARLLTESQLVISQLEIISNENTRRNWNTEISARKPRFRYSATGVHPIEKQEKPKEKNVLEIPIVLRGQKIGNILLQRKADFQKWTTQEEAIAKDVATQTALALENIRLVERTKERANREQAISSISTRIRETLDLDIVLRTSAREIQKALNLQEAEIRLFPENHLDANQRN